MGGRMEVVIMRFRNTRVFFVFILILFFGFQINLKAEFKKDTLVFKPYRDTVKLVKAQIYKIDSSKSLLFYKPVRFQFIRNVPSDFVQFSKVATRKKNLPTLGLIAGSTIALLVFDQQILDATQQFGRYLNIDPERKSNTVIEFKAGGFKVPVLDIPQNFNSTLYFIGEGWPSVMIAGGLYGYGSITKNYRALQTSSQLAEMFVTLAVTTQLLKRISGRESPFQATQDGGKWRPFTNPSVYQKKVSKYDAFPSGHLATVIATITILSGNYPEYRYIKPVGYSIMGLVAFSMVNNGVHWVSDYPLAIAIGYTYGRIAVSRGHIILPRSKSNFACKSTIFPVMMQNGYGLSYRYTF